MYTMFVFGNNQSLFDTVNMNIKVKFEIKKTFFNKNNNSSNFIYLFLICEITTSEFKFGNI